MLKKLFTRNANNKVVVAEEKKQNLESLIEEIHESFYTEVDRLLADAKILVSTETQLQDLLDKAEQLKKLGFINIQKNVRKLKLKLAG